MEVTVSYKEHITEVDKDNQDLAPHHGNIDGIHGPAILNGPPIGLVCRSVGFPKLTNCIRSARNTVGGQGDGVSV